MEKEHIVIIGYGWVGQANAVALSDMGHRVSFYDISSHISRHYEDQYTDQYKLIGRINNPLDLDSPSTIYMVCVGDKVLEDGNQNISNIKNALDSIKGAQGKIILRSTILPDKLGELNFDIYMPEFLHEKTAVKEAMDPHYFVVGKRSPEVKYPEFFAEWRKRSFKSIDCTPKEASYIKYLSNVWNAQRIAFVNEFGRSMHITNNLNSADTVLKFLFEDKPYFQYGRAFSGHCLPKDTKAYALYSSKHIRPFFLGGVLSSNIEQEKFQESRAELKAWYSPWRRIELSGKEAFKALIKAIINILPLNK